LSEANETVRVLQEKIEKKYLKTPRDTIQYQIKSALVALDNFIADYPGTP
jgi:outer membrane protein assembly factor BamD